MGTVAKICVSAGILSLTQCEITPIAALTSAGIARSAALANATDPAALDDDFADRSWREPYAGSERERALSWVSFRALRPEIEAATRPAFAPRRPPLDDDSVESMIEGVLSLGAGDPRGLRFVRTINAERVALYGWVSPIADSRTTEHPRRATVDAESNHLREPCRASGSGMRCSESTPRAILDLTGNWRALNTPVDSVDVLSHARSHLERGCSPLDLDARNCSAVTTLLFLRVLGTDSIEWRRNQAPLAPNVLYSTVVDSRLRSLFEQVRRDVRAGRDLDAVRAARAVSALLAVTAPSAALTESQGLRPSAFEIAREWARLAVDRAQTPIVVAERREDEPLAARVERLLTEITECRAEESQPHARCAPQDELATLGLDSLPLLINAIRDDRRVCRTGNDVFRRPPRLADALYNVVMQRIERERGHQWHAGLRWRLDEHTWSERDRGSVARILRERLASIRAVAAPSPHRPLRALDVLRAPLVPAVQEVNEFDEANADAMR